MNQLTNQKSPYLLQHADNPVNWYPWGEEAFSKARKEDMPVFLSIGYSTCHWCHVMEHESFENAQIAQILNEHFISIKVDREERPDIDNVYMSAVISITGQGGWPLSVFLTPDKEPFYGGTYFPPFAKWGSPGFTDLLQSIAHSWKNNRQRVLDSGAALTEALKERAAQLQQGIELNPDIMAQSFQQYLSHYDSEYGGFGTAPKFPTSHNLSLLLRYYKRSGETKALSMVEQTLTAMAHGGLYDYLGGGFHRYSTDQKWQIPHFEKMLYDQAILARTYLEAYQVTKNEFYAQIARSIFDYVLRDMTHREGGFYSAEDADSLDPDYPKEQIKKEGAFYLWREDEVESLLGKEDAQAVQYYFGFSADGNAEVDPHNEFNGKNVLAAAHTLKDTATHLSKTEDSILQSLKRAKEKLLAARTLRPRPHLDDKILTDWNGLMIGSLAFGARVLNEPKYSEAAQKSADFLIKQLIAQDGRLLHRYREGEAAINATIEDYAFFVSGLIELYEATFVVAYLEKAKQLAERMMDDFWDEKNGGFQFTGKRSEQLLFVQKEIYDGAIPSGNSMAALALVKLAHITLDERWENALEKMFPYFAPTVNQQPNAYSQFLIAVDYFKGPSREIVIAQSKTGDNVDDFINTIYNEFIPNKVVILRPYAPDQAEPILALSPFVDRQSAIKEKTAVYVCENHVCQLPVDDVEGLQRLLRK